MPLCHSILVLKQLITDEPNSRAVEPKLLYEFVSMVLCTPSAQLVGLAVDALQPLIHLEHFAEHLVIGYNGERISLLADKDSWETDDASFEILDHDEMLSYWVHEVQLLGA